MSRSAEVVIAGAGMAGLAVAYELAVRAGVGRVVVVDPREPLSLTSSRGAEAYRNYWPGPDDAMAGPAEVTAGFSPRSTAVALMRDNADVA